MTRQIYISILILNFGSYILNSIENRYDIKDLSFKYFNLDISEYLPQQEKQQSLFNELEKDYSVYFYTLLFPKILLNTNPKDKV